MVRSLCRSSSGGRFTAVLIVIATTTTAATLVVSAHRRDEYLQAARLAIEPARVQIHLDLTPGIAVADTVLRQIDRDRTGTISADEGQAYADVVLKAVRLESDGQPLRLELSDRRFPAIEAVRRGEGVIRLEFTAAMPPLSPGAHTLRYRNSHRPEIGVYLANALVPASERLTVTAQRRDVDQRELTVDLVLRPEQTTGVRPPVVYKPN